MDFFEESRFKRQVDAAMKAVKTVLDNTRNPALPPDVEHTYDDKYLVTEFMTVSTLTAFFNTLELIGVSAEGIQKLSEWSKTRSVTIAFSAEERCTFDREETKEVESKDSLVAEHSNNLGYKSETKLKVVTKVTDYFWKFHAEYKLYAYQGNDTDNVLVLRMGAGDIELKTATNVTPKPQVSTEGPITANITWLFQRFSESANHHVEFSIDRSTEECRTPRRNPEVAACLRVLTALDTFANDVHRYFKNRLFPVQNDLPPVASSVTVDSLFVPILPLMEAVKKGNSGNKASDETHPDSSGKAVVMSGTSVVPVDCIGDFTFEQRRSLGEKCADLNKIFPSQKLAKPDEATLMLFMLHWKQICQYYHDGVNYIEDLLRKQLISAIGKEVTPVDFTNYMVFHNRKLFKKDYETRPFCYAIRRPDHYPEGTVTIEASLDDGSLPQPIPTIVRKLSDVSPMQFALDASTNVTFKGERYIHGWIGNQFSGYSGVSLSLQARARQFSSFILLAGRIVSQSLFEPSCGIIIQNKDELKIVLDLEQIPSAKEFKDAIASLSPEQQRFAKAFRSMQLESTLFGVLVVQIKPQLEKLLKLPNDCLTKEISLTQDILELFMKYQIPSDLISFDGDENDTKHAKLRYVKECVKAMQDMITKSKKKEIKEKAMETSYQFGGIPTPQVQYSAYSASIDCFMAPPPPPSAASCFGGAPPPAPGGPPPPSAPPPSAPPPSAPPAIPSPSVSASNQEKKDSNSPKELPEFVPDASEQGMDFTKLPNLLDTRFEKLDEDGAVRPTIINLSNNWVKKAQESLLADPTTKSMGEDDQMNEKNGAFDLLDALSRSGALDVDEATLHVVLAATHCFDMSLIDTVVKGNVNPIEKVEKSSLIMAATIHETDPLSLIKSDQVERVTKYVPDLFTEEAASVLQP